MSIETAPYYWIECNGCNRSSQEDAKYSAFSDVDQAIEQAIEYADWLATADGKHWCSECTDYCADCEEYKPKSEPLCERCQKLNAANAAPLTLQQLIRSKSTGNKFAAYQLTATNASAVINWCHPEKIGTGCVFQLRTRGRSIEVNYGDWIINTGVPVFDVLDPEVFDDYFEIVERDA